jgi:hypothetical protein
MEDLLVPGARGAAEAQARYGNTSARQALNDLAAAIAGLKADAGQVGSAPQSPGTGGVSDIDDGRRAARVARRTILNRELRRRGITPPPDPLDAA